MKATQIVREPMPYGSVLLVDDLETNLYVGKGLLAPYGLSVDVALSGAEAIDKIRGGKTYDVVFMDHMMPEMDGVQATKILRELGYARPIVALTANAVVGQEEMFLANGFDEFLSKPIDIRRMNLLLNRLVRDRRPPETPEAALRERGTAGAGAPQADPELVRMFIRDAEKAVAVLEETCGRSFSRDDLRSFVVQAHAAKSALANIGESGLSAVALRLELAGQTEDLDVLAAETPAFVNALRAVIEKMTPTKGSI
jgi:CheY-like chemotaxis protein